MGRKKQTREPFWKRWGPESKHITDHVGRFVDRLTMSDLLNVIAFSAGAYATYFGVTKAAELSSKIPDWLKIISSLSPFLYQIVIPSEVAKNMSETDKLVLALLGGYSTVKLAPVVVQATVSAGKSLAGVG
jgi:hypothetical protein